MSNDVWIYGGTWLYNSYYEWLHWEENNAGSVCYVRYQFENGLLLCWGRSGYTVSNYVAPLNWVVS